jgi:hypothetical protein
LRDAYGLNLAEHPREGRGRIGQPSHPEHPCEDFFIAEVDKMGESLRAGKDHGDKGDGLFVYPHAIRGALRDRYGLLDHPDKSDPLKECRNKGEASIGRHLPPREGDFRFVHPGHRGKIHLHTFVLLSRGVGCRETIDSIAKEGFLLRDKWR